MNDRQNPYVQYDQYGQPMQLVGYDEYGQPVYQQVQPPQDQQQQPQQHQAPHHQQPHHQQSYDPYAQQHQQAPGYGYDPYAQQQPPPASSPYQGQGQGQGQSQGQGYGYDTGQTGQQPAVDTTQQWIPQQSRPEQPQREQSAQPVQSERSEQPPEQPKRAVPGQRRPAQGDDEYRTEQFSFIEEPDEDSEDVIDWLKFTESRTERREEARRRGRTRVVSLVVVLALVVVGGVGYLWYAGKLPGVSGAGGGATASGAQQRNAIVVHLHNTKGGGTSTALLVDNVTTGKGTTLLLPNSLSVSNDDGTATTLGKSVDDDGSDGTREALDTLLGAKIGGTWRLDTPYLENLVELIGNIDIDTDTDVPDTKKGAEPLVHRGKDQTLSGQMAVAYSTYRAPGEPEAKQLERFGQVMQGVLKKISDDPQAATTTVKNLAQILDPSLSDKDLGASLAKLAAHAKKGDYTTELLPVRSDGTLSPQASASVVKDVLGGSVKAPDQGDSTSVGVSNASGRTASTESARIALVNGGYSVVDGGKASVTASSQVSYSDPAQKAKADEVAKTLGLPAGAVRKGKAAANADVSVVLGQDYKIN
ncbi:LytR C-terminal domain-containing protein [Streptomyces sp. NPDC059398]|uniref:LCP family protein n=1 Tax=Streptomyces sp. NPDC059398 TaxID=3346820 RepID=UPI00369F8AF1